MIINIDTDYIMSLYNCDADIAKDILADLEDTKEKFLDNLDDAIIGVVYSSIGVYPLLSHNPKGER
jgi:hypothetical protein